MKTRLFYARKKWAGLLKTAESNEVGQMAASSNAGSEPSEIEMLLPWHAAGTEPARCAPREEALAQISRLRSNTP